MSDKTTVDHAVRRNLGMCPGCKAYLWADVTVRTTVDAPWWSTDAGAPTAAAYADVVAVSLSAHECTEGVMVTPEEVAEIGRKAQEVAWEVGYLRGALDEAGDMERADNPYAKEAP